MLIQQIIIFFNMYRQSLQKHEHKFSYAIS